MFRFEKLIESGPFGLIGRSSSNFVGYFGKKAKDKCHFSGVDE